MSDQSTTSELTYLVILDSCELRRAEIECFLKPWAEASGLTIRATGAGPEAVDSRFFCRLLILNIGGTSCDGKVFDELVQIAREIALDAPIVVFSDQDVADQVVAAFRSGVRGFIPNTTPPAVALQALTFILAGGNYFPPTALLSRNHLSRASDPMSGPHLAPIEMTTRQEEVLGLLRMGKPNKVIARELQMQESTVKVHVRQIMRKLGVTNRTQAALCQGADGAHKSADPISTVIHDNPLNGAPLHKPGVSGEQSFLTSHGGSIHLTS